MAYDYALSKGTILRHSSMLGKESVYTIEKVLGQGGFGITYLASMTIIIGHTPHKIRFAIKEFFVKGQCWREPGNPQMKYSPAAKVEIDECKKDFIDEANRLNKICSENINIVNVNEVFEANETAYYVMEYLSGDSLRDMILKNKGPLSETDALSMIIPIAESVEYLHDQYKLLHCDISPDNIMLRNNEDGYLTPVLIDFGESLHFNSKGELTTTHNAIGAKEGYAPQEQYRGVTSFDSRIDVYALGATLFYLLTGKKPISAFDISKENIDKNLPSHVSENIREAVLHAMAKDKENRTKTVKEFVSALRNDQQEPPHNPTPETLPIGHNLYGGSGKAYEITAISERTPFFVRYKAERVSVGTSQHSSNVTRRARCDVYEYYDQNNHQRDENLSLIPIGDLSVSQQQFLSFCKEKTGTTLSASSWHCDEVRWDAFKSNNTLYIVDNHYRNPLPWRKLVTATGVCICSVLLVFGCISIYNSIKKPGDIKRFEMSQRLTEAIKTNDIAVLREFAEKYDSTRACLPYALICYNNGDLDAAERFANDSLRAIIKQKRDSIAQTAQLNAQEQNIDGHSVNEEDNTRHARYQELLSTARQNLNKNLGVAERAIQNIISLNKSYADSAEVRKLQDQIAAIKREQERKKELAKLKERQEQAYIEGVSLYNAWSRHKRLGDESEEMIEKRRQAALKRLNDAEMSKVQKMLDNLKSNK